MTSAWLLLLFGLTFIGAACNTPTWWVMAFRRNVAWRFRAVRIALALFSAALLLGCWTAASEAATHPAMRLNPIPLIVGFSSDLRPIFIHAPPQFASIYLTLFVIAEMLMLLASANALWFVGKRSISLRVYLVLAPLWIVGLTLWGLL